VPAQRASIERRVHILDAISFDRNLLGNDAKPRRGKN
jgi:hypothetical protein